MKHPLLFALLASISTIARSAGGSGILPIAQVTISPQYSFATISGTSIWSNPDGCATSTQVVLQFSNPYYKEALATILMAHASGKSITFWVDGCVWTPWGVSPTVVSVTAY